MKNCEAPNISSVTLPNDAGITYNLFEELQSFLEKREKAKNNWFIF